jgi:hypothetical protein
MINSGGEAEHYNLHLDSIANRVGSLGVIFYVRLGLVGSGGEAEHFHLYLDSIRNRLCSNGVIFFIMCVIS